MRISKKIGLSTITLVTLAVAAQAQIIGIDFTSGTATPQSPLSTNVAGPVASAGWNNTVDVTNAPFNLPAADNTYNSTTTPLTLVDSNGTTTTGNIGFVQYGYGAASGRPVYNPGYGAVGSANGALTPDQQLYNGAATASTPGYAQEFTLQNIPYSSFSVYVLGGGIINNLGYGPYGYFGEGSIQIFTGSTSPLAGATYYLGDSNYGYSSYTLPAGFSYLQATSTSLQSPTMGANYALFSGLTGGAGSSYTFDVDAPTGNTNADFMPGGAFVSAIEIVDNVPEPSTYAMMLGGLGMLLGMQIFRRRRS